MSQMRTVLSSEPERSHSDWIEPSSLYLTYVYRQSTHEEWISNTLQAPVSKSKPRIVGSIPDTKSHLPYMCMHLIDSRDAIKDESISFVFKSIAFTLRSHEPTNKKLRSTSIKPHVAGSVNLKMRVQLFSAMSHMRAVQSLEKLKTSVF